MVPVEKSRRPSHPEKSQLSLLTGNKLSVSSEIIMSCMLGTALLAKQPNYCYQKLTGFPDNYLLNFLFNHYFAQSLANFVTAPLCIGI